MSEMNAIAELRRRGVITDACGPYCSPELAALLDRIAVRRER